ncbi:dihydrolipoamide acetyltransferase family protein (plasmid) [Sphingobium sp. SJ10-10]|uniref:dihydrolipoamide acetyltransferase family protein n=1 Tax=unclassified Sphingobium TaxID=2611147 RepID=UPI00076FEFFE|nr:MULTISPECIES: dihydrolipoamide acetyltransferase family protein [unclassified Sphingobium]AMK26551.1 dihydrolipoyllysine-residue acetyltransferase [Sphingobium sp. TKS]MEC6699575.1 dihydrolipoamide acetyltransferase family protein [Sphingobium sp. SJ10-10]
MAIELTMPALSPTMEKGTLAKWLVKVGDTIKPGDLIAEIETDKATMELAAIDEGTIASLAIPEGSQDVPVGTVIATVAEAGEKVDARALETVSAAPVQERASLAPPAAVPPAPVADPAPAPRTPAPDNGTINATPLAKRIATVRGLSLLGIAGSGARGRIVKADLGLPSLLAPAMAVPAIAPAAIAAPVYDPPAGVPVNTVKLTTMRKTIARRLTESKQNVPHFYLTARCNIDAFNRLRGELNAGLDARGIKLSVNDLLIKAMALAMTAVPDVNVQFGGEVLHRFARVDIAMAVAIEGGLVTPVIRDAGALSLSAIAQASKALAIKARDGKLAPEDYQGGTASISNLGMLGIDEMFPVINLPQALILGVAAGVEQPWKVDGGIALATIMAATASFDHRAIDGATAAQFMAALRDLIEHPLQIVS